MKFCLLSDLHLEFAPYKWPDPKTYDVLMLAGDICSWKSPKAKAFVKYLESHKKLVIYAPGNEDYYGGTIQDNFERQDRWGRTIHNEMVCSSAGQAVAVKRLYEWDDWYDQCDNVSFFISTMWTDFNNSNKESMAAAKRLDDYKFIDNPLRMNGKDATFRLTPEDTVRINSYTKKSLELFLEDAADDEKSYLRSKVIVVTHHSPLEDQECEGLDVSGGENDAAHVCSWAKDIIKKNKIDVWCHGHTHKARDIMYEGTRIICNPRGYVGIYGKNQECKEFKKEGFIFEL